MKNESKSYTKQVKLAKYSSLIFFSILAIIVLVPIYAIFISSFKSGQDIIRNGFNLSLDFDNMSLDNYKLLLSGTTPYFNWLKNSLVIVIFQVSLTLLISSWVAYGFSMYEFKGKKILFMCVLLILMVPFEILMLPLYQITITLNLIDSNLGVFIPFLASASTIFFFRQFLTGIPKELMEAGRIDGCSEYGIYFKIMTPIMKPAFAAMAILSAMGSWNGFLWPLIVLRTDTKFTLPIGLSTLLTPYGNNYDLLIVGSCFSIVPVLIIFLMFQKYFIEGLTAGSVKG